MWQLSIGDRYAIGGSSLSPRVENVVEADSATTRFIGVVDDGFRIPRIA
jgi:hypothetical protein